MRDVNVESYRVIIHLAFIMSLARAGWPTSGQRVASRRVARRKGGGLMTTVKATPPHPSPSASAC